MLLTVVSGFALLVSRRVGQIRLKLVLLMLYPALMADLIYEDHLGDVLETNGNIDSRTGIFGAWWPFVLMALVVGIIALQATIYLRWRKQRSEAKPN